jgi:hypothetical protein
VAAGVVSSDFDLEQGPGTATKVHFQNWYGGCGCRQKGRRMRATGWLTVVGPGWQTGFSQACRNICDDQSATGRKTLNKIRP